MYPDHSAAAFIAKLEVYSSSQLVETINGYNVLYASLLDSQMGPLDRMGPLSIVAGTDLDAQSNTVNFSRGGINMTYGNTYTFAVPLVSGIIGTNLNKMLPVGLLQDCRLEITWENNANAIISATNTAVSTNVWTVTSAELVLQVLTLNSDVHNMIANKDTIMISSESYRNYNTVLNAANTSDNIILPLKFTSIKSLLNVYRLQNNMNTFNNASLTSRRNPFASTGATVPNIQWLLGNVYAPAVPLRSVAEIYSEYSKALHSLGNVNNKTVLNRQTYDQAVEPTFYGAVINLANTSNVVSAIATNGQITCTSTAGFEVGQPITFYGTNSSLGQVQFGGVNGTFVPGTTTVNPTTYYISSIVSSTVFTIALTPQGFTQMTVATAINTQTTLFLVTKEFYAQQTPSFVMGLNTDTMYQASNNSMSGINSTAGNCFLNATYSAATPTGGQRFDAWAHYDFLIMIDPHSKQMSIRV